MSIREAISQAPVSGVRVEIYAPGPGWRRRRPLRLTARVFLQVDGVDAIAYQPRALAAGESLTVNLPDQRKTPPASRGSTRA